MTFAGEAAAPVHHAQAVPLSGVALGGGAVLLLPGRPADDDYAAITTAAAPLVDLLTARGLISPTDADTSVKPGSGPLAHHDGSSR
jgi:hypothetical protein